MPYQLSEDPPLRLIKRIIEEINAESALLTLSYLWNIRYVSKLIIFGLIFLPSTLQCVAFNSQHKIFFLDPHLRHRNFEQV